ncbi:MAG TPA: tRNA pseudouridine(55) synthase TruB [Steroidobacteraceae bacterium]|jgi:tRNA pseudouridine55 synthase|nr:tRNA pseudouridine(55) synthase TruB [Steroidobacteraceae bacterium]
MVEPVIPEPTSVTPEPTSAAALAVARPAPAPLVGILLLDKPLGLSSNAALQVVRRLAGGIKAGHSGSLDPLASGMLPICLGEATRLAGQLLEGRKAYRFGLTLGERSATGDAEGEIVERCAVPPLDRAAIEAVLVGFLGTQQQVPPMYSALKRDGEPLYRLARRGVQVERAARALVIDALQLQDHQNDRLELSVLCSKGTYVRVLAEDIARALGSCGRLHSLRRDYVEPFAGEPMVSLEQLQAAARDGSGWPVLAPDRAVSHLPPLRLDADAAAAIAHGRVLPFGALLPPGDPGPAQQRLWRLYDAQGRFLGLGASDAAGLLRAQRLFAHPVVV